MGFFLHRNGSYLTLFFVLLAGECIHKLWQFGWQGEINGVILLTSNKSMPLRGWKHTAKQHLRLPRKPSLCLHFEMLHPVVGVRKKKTRKLWLVQFSTVLCNQHLLRHFHTYLVCSSHFNPVVVCLGVWELCNHTETLLRGWFVSTFPNKPWSFVWIESVIHCSCRTHWALWVK